jgi:molybdopterin synthase catalytic subunit
VAVELRADPFEPYGELCRYQSRPHGRPIGAYGATASFVGTMRDFNDGDRVQRMMLEYYPGMTERELERIVDLARAHWSVFDILVLHRTGEIGPGDPIVLVAVWSEHRGPAFDACRFIMEELKNTAPFWKKETLMNRERWVEQNTSGYSISGSSDNS